MYQQRRRTQGEARSSGSPTINFQNVEEELLAPHAIFNMSFKCDGDAMPGIK